MPTRSLTQKETDLLLNVLRSVSGKVNIHTLHKLEARPTMSATYSAWYYLRKNLGILDDPSPVLNSKTQPHPRRHPHGKSRRHVRGRAAMAVEENGVEILDDGDDDGFEEISEMEMNVKAEASMKMKAETKIEAKVKAETRTEVKAESKPRVKTESMAKVNHPIMISRKRKATAKVNAGLKKRGRVWRLPVPLSQDGTGKMVIELDEETAEDGMAVEKKVVMVEPEVRR